MSSDASVFFTFRANCNVDQPCFNSHRCFVASISGNIALQPGVHTPQEQPKVGGWGKQQGWDPGLPDRMMLSRSTAASAGFRLPGATQPDLITYLSAPLQTQNPHPSSAGACRPRQLFTLKPWKPKDQILCPSPGNGLLATSHTSVCKELPSIILAMPIYLIDKYKDSDLHQLWRDLHPLNPPFQRDLCPQWMIFILKKFMYVFIGCSGSLLLCSGFL